MTLKELKEKLEKLHVPDEAEIQVLTEASVADAVMIGLNKEPWHNNRQVLTFYTQPGIEAIYKAIKEEVHNKKQGE